MNQAEAPQRKQVHPEGIVRVCKCHGELMQWRKTKGRKNNGKWQCAVRARERAQRYNERHCEERRAYHLRHYYKNTERFRENNRLWRAANTEKIREYNRRYRADNLERERSRNRENNRRFRSANPEKAREQYHKNERRRRARKAKVPFEPYTRAEVFGRTDGECYLCLALLASPNWPDMHIDHCIPLAAHGPDILDNAWPACPACNLMKGQSTLENLID